MNIGKRIRRRRKELNMSAEELAKRLGKDRSTIYRYEKGDIENMPLDILEPIAKVLEITPGELMGWEKVEKKADILSDIVLRAKMNEEFLALLEMLRDLDEDQIRSVKQMISSFLK